MAARRAAPPPPPPARSGRLLDAIRAKQAREADAAQRHRDEYHSGGDTVCLACAPESYTVYYDGPEPTAADLLVGNDPRWVPALTVAGPPGRDIAVLEDGAVSADPSLALPRAPTVREADEQGWPRAPATPLTDYTEQALAADPDAAAALALLLDAEASVQRIKAARGVPGSRWRSELAAAWGRDLPEGTPGKGRGPMRLITVEFTDGYRFRYTRGVLVSAEHARHAGLVVAELARRNHWTIHNVHGVQMATP